MSIPSIASPSGFEMPSPSAPHTEYKSKTNIYREVKHLLGQPLNIAGRLPHQTVQFSLGELFQHLQIHQVILKGSVVHHTKTDAAPHDIDIHVQLEAPKIKLEQLNQLLEFIKRRNGQNQTDPSLAIPKTWLSNHTYTVTPAWTRLIIHVGYPRKNHTVIDLCYSSQPKPAYDVLGASKTLAIDLETQKAHVIDKWHPSIVAWVKENNLLWFHPDIENGLGRLSYRLSKPEQFYLLQPQLPRLFCQQSNPENILNIYKRLLRNEYSKGQLSSDERASLWLPIIQMLQELSPSNENPYAGLIQGFKSWSKFNDLNRLSTALEDPDSQETVFQRLCNAYRVGSNFQTDLNTLLLATHEDLPLKNHLEPIIHRALGAHMVPPQTLFNQLDSLPNIESLPKTELQTLLLDCLHHYIDVGDDATVAKAQHTIGWLQGDPLSTLLFQLDRLHRNQSSASNKTGKKHNNPQLLKSIDKVLKANPSLEHLAPALPLLMQQKLNKDGCHQLIQMLFKVKGIETLDPNNNPENIGLRLMNVFAHHAAILNNETGCTIPTDSIEKNKLIAFHREISTLFDGLKLNNMPMLFNSILSNQNKTFYIDLPKLTIEIEPSQAFVTLKIGNNKRFINNVAMGSIMPALNAPHDEMRIHWHDGCAFVSKPLSNNQNAHVEGTFSSPLKHTLPTGLAGLIQLGRALCSTQYEEFCYDDHLIQGEGTFHAPSLIKAKHVLDALKSLNTGSISDHSTFDDTEITHHILNGKPSHCTVSYLDDGFVDNFSLDYNQTTHNNVSEFKNAWHLPVGLNLQVERLFHLTDDHNSDIHTWLSWNPVKRSFDGPCTIKGQGNQGTFHWKGEKKDFKLSAAGELFVNDQSNPALSFSSTHPTDTIPESLVVLIGTWLTNKHWGNYPFKPVVWPNNNAWPPEHFEGFIFQFKQGENQFTGYKTQAGKAVGIWFNHADSDDQMNASIYTGSFLIQKRTNLAEHIPPFHATAGRVEMPLSKELVLLPHGFIEQQLITPNSEDQPKIVIPWMYFMGRGVSYSETAPETHHQGLSPAASYQLQGKNYKDSTTINKDIHVVLNPEDGGPDFVFIHPHERKQSYQLIYQDSLGVTQKLLLMNHEYRMGEFHLPNQVKISGEIRAEHDQFHLTGRLKASIHDVKFSGHLKHGEHQIISGLKGDTSESEELLDILKENHGQEFFTLAELISFISGERLSYKHNIQPFLKERSLPTSSHPMKSIRFTFPQNHTEI